MKHWLTESTISAPVYESDLLDGQIKHANDRDTWIGEWTDHSIGMIDRSIDGITDHSIDSCIH